jgi:hypothetical protein
MSLNGTLTFGAELQGFALREEESYLTRAMTEVN